MALIDASMIDEIFESTMPFSRDANQRFILDIDGTTLELSSGTLQVGVVDTTNIAPGAIDATKLNITSTDVPHSSPSVSATDVHDALEEVAVGYIARLPLAGGTMVGDINMGGNEVTGLALATDPTDAMSLESGQILVRDGDFYKPPTGYAGVGAPNGSLKATWVRATASAYFTALPAPGDQLVINGVTLTFQTVGGPNLIEIGVDEATTALNAVAEINVNTTLTLDGIPLNANFFAIQASGTGTGFHLIVLNEDPPNTPEDGNLKPLSEVSSAIVLRPFEGGMNIVENGVIVPDLFTNAVYIYDLMQPSAPWIAITGGGGGSVDASDVWYTGVPIPNVDPGTPDNLENILISLDGVLGSGVLPSAHAVSHQNAGSDEVNVGGLSGLLGDPQTPLAHVSTHQNGGGDELNVNGLNGQLADLQDAGWLQGRAVSGAAPGVSQVLTWGGASWAPASTGAGADFDTLTSVVGVGLAVNDVVYVSSSNTVMKADATTAATGPAIGIVVASAAGIVDVRMFGKVTTFVGLVPGTQYFVSTTAGGLTTTPPSLTGQYSQSVGIALTATTLIVDRQRMIVNT
jgi:hypothetical protein